MPSPIRRMTLRAAGRSPTPVNVRLDTSAFRESREPERETGLAIAMAGPASAQSFFRCQYRTNRRRCRVSLLEGARQSFADAGGTTGKRFQGWRGVGRPWTMVLGPLRDSAGLAGRRDRIGGTATEAAEATGAAPGEAVGLSAASVATPGDSNGRPGFLPALGADRAAQCHHRIDVACGPASACSLEPRFDHDLVGALDDATANG